MTQQPQNEPPIPWHLGIYDAHCHPTDTMTSIADIPAMKATTLTIMATRGEDQDLVAEAAGLLGKQNRAGAEAGGAGNARDEARVVPCFGWHPWFSHLIVDDTTTTTASISRPTAASGDRHGDEDPGAGREWELKKPHYKTVLAPSPDTQNEAFISALPSPIPLSQLITQTRTRLLSHPTALVGEIGLDRAFRLPNPWTTQDLESRDGAVTPGSREGRTLSPYRVQLEHQKAVLRAQLRLAGELERAVSVHSVQTHGVVFEVLKELWSGFERKQLSKKERRRRRGSVESAAHIHEVEDHSEPTTSTIPHEGERKPEARDDRPARPFPPRICMHSYSGPVEPIKQFLHPSNPSDVYFSFSSVINFHGPSVQKAIDAVQAVPDDRILIESDMHTAGEKMDELLADVVRTVCWLRGWELEDGVRRLGENWRKFVFG